MDAKYQDVKFLAGPEHPRKHVPLPPPKTVTCTTTSHDDRCENVYFHLHRIELEPPRNARFKGITAENDRRGTNACVLYEMPAFAPCPKLSRACFSSLPCHHLVGTRYPGSPHLLSHVTLSSLFLLHRYLHELSGPECCRGTIFVSPPWHPFRSAMATNASYHAHVNVFIKLHKLAYVIRIMITTIKMFKIVVALNC